MSGYIYFLQPRGRPGPIKIGYSAVPADRLQALSTWSPVPLDLLACVPAKRADERILHAHFRSRRCHGEWFEQCDEIIELIESAKLEGRSAWRAFTEPQRVGSGTQRRLQRKDELRVRPHDTSARAIADRVILAREYLGYGQAKLAGLFDFSQQRWGNYERGKCIPSPEVLLALFRLTGIGADFILLGGIERVPAAFVEFLQGRGSMSP